MSEPKWHDDGMELLLATLVITIALLIASRQQRPKLQPVRVRATPRRPHR